MAVTLYGCQTCTSCRLAFDELGKTPVDWRYVDVSTVPGYAGEIPMLQMEDGSCRIGLGAIMEFIRQWKTENGFL